MDDTTKDKLATNVQNSLKMASNWVMAAAGVMFAAYLAMPIEAQQALQGWIVSTLHIPAAVVPVLTAALGIAARLWPQKSISPDVAAAKSADAPVDPAVKDSKS